LIIQAKLQAVCILPILTIIAFVIWQLQQALSQLSLGQVLSASMATISLRRLLNYGTPTGLPVMHQAIFTLPTQTIIVFDLYRRLQALSQQLLGQVITASMATISLRRLHN
jgi:Na+/glutamate symporter